MKKRLLWIVPLAVILIASVIYGVTNEEQEEAAVDPVAVEEPKEEPEAQEEEVDEAAAIVKEFEEAKAAEENEKEEVQKITIPEEAINMAVDTTKQDQLVTDAHIEVNDDRILISIIVNAAITEDKAKEVGENAVRQLAAFSGYGTPTKDYLGEIYDHYDLMVGVGTGPDNIIAQGAKVTVASKITW